MWAKFYTFLKDLTTVVLLFGSLFALLWIGYGYDNCHKWEAIARQQAQEMACYKVEADLQRNLRLYERKQQHGYNNAGCIGIGGDNHTVIR